MVKYPIVTEYVVDDVRWTRREFENGSIVEDGVYITKNDANYLEPVPQPTEAEVYQAETLLNQAQIMETQKAHDEVLAQLLLNQMGV